MVRAEEAMEISSLPGTPRGDYVHPVVSPPPFQLHSPSLTRSPLLQEEGAPPSGSKTRVTRIFSPLGSPAAVKKAAASMKGYVEEAVHLTKLGPRDDWLPITESRNGNAYYAAFHTLCAGIGFQALLLPAAFTYLGWFWGILSLVMMFGWQLYTLWALAQLHESTPGTRYSRYLHLCISAFGEKLGKWLAMVPIMYLSAGTCTVLIIIGGGSMKLFYEFICGPQCHSKPLTTIEWYLVFTCLAVVLSQLPNLNSLAGVSLIGAVSAVTYCTIIWTLSLSKERPSGISHKPADTKSDTATMLGVINSLGIIAFAFRGHNLTLEIQGTLPSSFKHPSSAPMWKGIKIAYTVIASCLFPITLIGYWAYGSMIPANGILNAVYVFHRQDTSAVILGTAAFLVVANCLASFQIYGMPIFDDMEFGYTTKHNKPCPRLLRSGLRIFFGFFSFFIAVAFPFLSSLAGLIGAVSLPVTLAYPCFMWILIKKPERFSKMWFVNWILGCLGTILSILLIVGGMWSLVETGLKLRFFKT